MGSAATAYSGQGSNRAARLLSSAASDNATVAINGPGQLQGVIGYNNKATAVFLKIYALAATLATPTNADTPALTILLPGASAFAIDIPKGFNFNFGLGFRITTGVADADNTAIAVGDIQALNLLVA